MSESPAPPALSLGWQKLSVLATVLSTVVLGAIGLVITHRQGESTQMLTLGQQQISKELNEITRTRNASDEELEKARIAHDLLKLLFEKGQHRNTILVVIQPYLPAERYTNMLSALAKEDQEDSVRLTAVRQLAKTPTSTATAALSAVAQATLNTIAQDQKRPEPERAAAQKATTELQNKSEVFQRIRNLQNSSPKARIRVAMTGDCQSITENRFQCSDGDMGTIAVTNQSQQVLYVSMIDLEEYTGKIIQIVNSRSVDPGATMSSPILYFEARLAATETIKVIATTEEVRFQEIFDNPKSTPPAIASTTWTNIDLGIALRPR